MLGVGMMSLEGHLAICGKARSIDLLRHHVRFSNTVFRIGIASSNLWYENRIGGMRPSRLTAECEDSTAAVVDCIAAST
jgi:hypothetical protein